MRALFLFIVMLMLVFVLLKACGKVSGGGRKELMKLEELIKHGELY